MRTGESKLINIAERKEERMSERKEVKKKQREWKMNKWESEKVVNNFELERRYLIRKEERLTKK